MKASARHICTATNSRLANAIRSQATPVTVLRRSITLAGIAATGAYAAHAALSWFLAPLAHYEVRSVSHADFFARIGETISGTRGGPNLALPPLQQALHGRGVFESKSAFVVAYITPQLVATAAAIAVVWVLWRHRDVLTPEVPAKLWRWALVFAVVCVFAVPVLVPDFWMSIAWGRTLAAGINPYYEVPPGATNGLPLEAPLMKMTYGPLWAYLSAAIMLVAGGDVWRGAILFKLALAGMWICLLWLVRALLRDRSIFEQTLGIVMIGWLPLGVGQTVSEGHNDVAMVACVLLWLYWRGHGKGLHATLALAASVLFKYASAPLFLVELLYREPQESRPPSALARSIALRATAALAVIAVVFAPLFRGIDFFASASDAYRGHFFLPADAVLALGSLSGLNLRFAAYAIEAVFPILALVAFYRYLRFGAPLLQQTAAAVMLSVILVGSGHLWPWYVLWYTAVAATIPLSLAGRWAAGLILVMPFPLLVWTVAPLTNDFSKFWAPSLIAYGVALACCLTIDLGRQSASRALAAEGTELAE